MKTVGIIAEYNPFHNGHAYQINEVKKITGADKVIVAMSGDFVQRGAPAIIDKYARADMALGCGADLVIELPVIWATSSAENFAMAGVTLLEKTGCADVICFGAECGDLSLLSEVADILLYEPEEFKSTLDLHLRNGINFPTARAAAIKKVLTSRATNVDHGETLDEVLGNPNNILAIEYLKALKRIGSSMTPCLIKREGAEYHNGGKSLKRVAGTPISNDRQDIKVSGDVTANERISMSASGIREALHDMADDKGFLKPPVSFDNAMPNHCVRILNEYAASYSLMDPDAFTSILNYLLLFYDRSDYYKFSDISPDLAARMESMRFETGSFDDICKKCKTRNMTYTRISRAFFHMILDIKDTDVERMVELSYIPYLRVLGLKKYTSSDGKVVALNPLTAALRKNASVPIITKLADAANVLSGDALDMLKTDIFASDLYAKTRLSNGQTCKNEYQKSPVIFSGENYLSTWD